ncbi:MAG: SDR family NAD(P)-dependent oxidoreductase [Myxococcota bacterium]|jgi:short-subunit dehydrogenase
MGAWARDFFRGRPTWMNVLMLFCAYMAFVYVPWDLFAKPVARDQEVWFGFLLTGWAAKAGAIPHWIVYAGGFYGFLRRRRWMAIAAPLYSLQVAYSSLVWGIGHFGGATGWAAGLAFAAPFVALALAFWKTRDHFRAPRVSLRKRYGEWALVTGASSGIGEAWARALAADGLSCALSARREDRLEALAAELEAAHGIETRIVPADLADPEGAGRVLEAVSDLEIAVLVNNAGVGCAGRFDLRSADELAPLVAVNCAAPLRLTSALLPAMRGRGRGAVILVGSIAGRQPLGLHAVYAATKGFDLLFGEALYVEMKPFGIDVLVVEPGTTETEFQQVAGEVPHSGVPPERVVEVSLEALGTRPSVVVGWFDWLRTSVATRLVPRSLTAWIGRDVMAARVPEDLH